jgi:urease accessory protein
MPLLCIDIGNTHTHYGVVGIDTTTDLGEVKTATLDDLGTATWRSDLAAMHHETQYTRLFRS